MKVKLKHECLKMFNLHNNLQEKLKIVCLHEGTNRKGGST